MMSPISSKEYIGPVMAAPVAVVAIRAPLFFRALGSRQVGLGRVKS